MLHAVNLLIIGWNEMTPDQLNKLQALVDKLESDIKVMCLYRGNKDMFEASAQSAENHIEQAKEILK